MRKYKDIFEKTGAYNCLDCGKCSANCHVAMARPYSSPRAFIDSALKNPEFRLSDNPLLWECTSCGMCSERCMSDVGFCDFIRMMREEARREGLLPEFTHSETIHSWMRIQAQGVLEQARLYWLDRGIGVRIMKDGDRAGTAKNETLFFVGCQPYYDVFFKELGITLSEGVNNSIKMLSQMGMNVCVMENESCCGHDLLWSGEKETFRTLADKNMERFEKSGIKRIVTSCAECYRTLKLDYGISGIDVLHTSEAVADGAKKIGLKSPLAGKVAYHDPCRLGRHCGIYEEPRKLLKAVEGIEIVELEYNRNLSECCGTNAWINCTSHSKKMQEDKLRMAVEAGAETIASSCPKCVIHLNCANSELGKEGRAFKLNIVDAFQLTRLKI